MQKENNLFQHIKEKIKILSYSQACNFIEKNNKQPFQIIKNKNTDIIKIIEQNIGLVQICKNKFIFMHINESSIVLTYYNFKSVENINKICFYNLNSIMLRQFNYNNISKIINLEFLDINQNTNKEIVLEAIVTFYLEKIGICKNIFTFLLSCITKTDMFNDVYSYKSLEKSTVYKKTCNYVFMEYFIIYLLKEKSFLNENYDLLERYIYFFIDPKMYYNISKNKYGESVISVDQKFSFEEYIKNIEKIVEYIKENKTFFDTLSNEELYLKFRTGIIFSKEKPYFGLKLHNLINLCDKHKFYGIKDKNKYINYVQDFLNVKSLATEYKDNKIYQILPSFLEKNIKNKKFLISLIIILYEKWYIECFYENISFHDFVTKNKKDILSFIDTVSNINNHTKLQTINGFIFLYTCYMEFLKRKEDSEKINSIMEDIMQNFPDKDFTYNLMIHGYKKIFFKKQIDYLKEIYPVVYQDIVDPKQNKIDIKTFFDIMYILITNKKIKNISACLTDNKNISSSWIRTLSKTILSMNLISRISYKYNFFSMIDSRIIGNMLKQKKHINFISLCLYLISVKIGNYNHLNPDTKEKVNVVINWFIKNYKEIYKNYKYQQNLYTSLIDYIFYNEIELLGVKKFNDKMNFDTVKTNIENFHILIHQLKETESDNKIKKMKFPKAPFELTNIDKFKIIPLETPEKIIEESFVMKHCVKTYANNIISGKTYIYSIQSDKKEDRATIEISITENTDATFSYNLVQYRSYCNKDITSNTYKILKKWCMQNNISL